MTSDFFLGFGVIWLTDGKSSSVTSDYELSLSSLMSVSSNYLSLLYYGVSASFRFMLVIAGLINFLSVRFFSAVLSKFLYCKL